LAILPDTTAPAQLVSHQASTFGAATTLHTPCKYIVNGVAASLIANLNVLSLAVTAEG
jgi:hypothetical protein